MSVFSDEDTGNENQFLEYYVSNLVPSNFITEINKSYDVSKYKRIQAVDKKVQLRLIFSKQMPQNKIIF